MQFICLYTVGLSALAQQPAYFILGKEEFNGIQVYDIIQNKQLNYLFATNEGIYYFDYHSFKKVECAEAKSNSVFKFEMDKSGTIYCHNLNNQVFQIDNDTCKLFYELEDDEAKADISLTVDEQEDVIIGARKIIVIKKDKSSIVRQSLGQRSIGPVFIDPNGTILYHLNGTDSIVKYQNHQTSFERITNSSGEKLVSTTLDFFTLGKNCYAFDKSSKAIYRFEPEQNGLTPLLDDRLKKIEGPLRIYQTGNEIWVAGSFPGVVVLNRFENTDKHEIFYEDYFISNVYKDVEGNILLGTFDNGILVVPDQHIPDVIKLIPDDPMISIYPCQQEGLFMGSSKGKLIWYDHQKFNILSDDGNHPVEGVYGNPNSDLIIFNNGNIQCYNKKSKVITRISNSSLKDAAIISNDEYYLGTNNGVIRVQNQTEINSIPQLRQRTYALEYNPQNKNLYVSTADGMLVLMPNGKTEKLLVNGMDFFPNSLYYYEGKILAPTYNKGILIIDEKQVKSTILPMVNGELEDLKEIVVHRNNIIGKSMHGLYRFDMKGQLLSSVHALNGLHSKRIIDFSIDSNKLWVCHSGGVQLVDLDYSRNGKMMPTIRIDKIRVNDIPQKNNSNGDFKTNESKIAFTFSSPTLKDMENIRYHYRLVGYDSEWKVQTYNQSEVTYNALAPGNYQFELKAQNQGVFSEILIYKFTIAKPFYSQWWFIVMIIIPFLGIVYLIYKWQLNIQNKKAQQLNELNASKLTAIQSQMNPHFIFNSLNSIQDLILKGDVEHSYSYITTFSNLVRRTLNYSDKDFIDFDQELKLIELYLSLEKLRYKKDLNYTIEVKNVEDIMIPPLLIQPFIENSLVHGLLHKEGEKRLKITFELKDSLICTIEDNGVGREQAKNIRLRQRSEHESFSGKAIHKRFEILSKVFKGKFGYVYEDLYQNQQPTGTKVVLTIPVKRKF